MSARGHTGPLGAQAVSRHSCGRVGVELRGNATWTSRRAAESQLERFESSGFRHSRVYRTFCFALLRDSLSFARPNERKQRKRRPAQRRLRRAVRGEEQGLPGVAGMRPPAFGMSSRLRLVRFAPPRVASHSFAAGRPCSASRGDTPIRSVDRMHAELGSLWRSSDMLRAPAPCAGHPSPLRHSVAALTGFQYKQKARFDQPDWYRLIGGRKTRSLYRRLWIGLQPIQNEQAETLSERQRSLSVLGPLGAAPSSADRKRKKTAGCLSVSEFPSVPLAVRDGRAPMQSIGARQGVFSFGYFRLDKQTKVTRTSVRHPNPKSITAVTSEVTRPQTARPSTLNAYPQPSPADTPQHGPVAPTTQRSELDRGRP